MIVEIAQKLTQIIPQNHSNKNSMGVSENIRDLDPQNSTEDSKIN